MTLAIEQNLIVPKLLVRPFRDRDISDVCSWVTTQAELQLVSGDIADCLTPEILRGWSAKAISSLVISQETSGKPVGFCTLSRLEAHNLPADYIELCHLIVNPRYKYLFIGSRLIDAGKLAARTSGYSFLCGRVVPTNRWGLALVKYKRASEFTTTEPWTLANFRWFRLALSPDGYGGEKRNGCGDYWQC